MLMIELTSELPCPLDWPLCEPESSRTASCGIRKYSQRMPEMNPLTWKLQSSPSQLLNMVKFVCTPFFWVLCSLFHCLLPLFLLLFGCFVLCMYVQFFVTSALSDLFAVGNTEKGEDEDGEEAADEAETTINTVKHLATFIKSGSAQQQQQR